MRTEFTLCGIIDCPPTFDGMGGGGPVKLLDGGRLYPQDGDAMDIPFGPVMDYPISCAIPLGF